MCVSSCSLWNRMYIDGGMLFYYACFLVVHFIVPLHQLLCSHKWYLLESLSGGKGGKKKILFFFELLSSTQYESSIVTSPLNSTNIGWPQNGNFYRALVLHFVSMVGFRISYTVTCIYSLLIDNFFLKRVSQCVCLCTDLIHNFNRVDCAWKSVQYSDILN